MTEQNAPAAPAQAPPAAPLGGAPAAPGGPGDPNLVTGGEPAPPPATPPAGAQPQAPAQSARPDYLLPQFESVEAQARAYVDAQKLIGRQAPQQPAQAPPAPAGAPGAGMAAVSPAGSLAPPTPAGLAGDWQRALAPYAQTWAQNGALSEAQYQQAEALGYPRGMVDQFFAGAKAQVDLRVQRAQERVGGRENLDAMLSWARGNLKPAELQQYEAARTNLADDGSFDRWVEVLEARWRSSTGNAPNAQLVGSGSANAGVKPFGSYAEYAAEVAKPEHDAQTPEGQRFRTETRKRLAASPWLKDFEAHADARNLS